MLCFRFTISVTKKIFFPFLYFGLSLPRDPLSAVLLSKNHSPFLVSSDFILPCSRTLTSCHCPQSQHRGKFTSISKSWRKEFKVKLEEQQKELKLIHEKFKKDINRHLQDCRSTLEGLEGHHLELKGTIEKQKALHRMLLLQVEEGVEDQLNHAQRRITAMHEPASASLKFTVLNPKGQIWSIVILTAAYGKWASAVAA